MKIIQTIFGIFIFVLVGVSVTLDSWQDDERERMNDAIGERHPVKLKIDEAAFKRDRDRLGAIGATEVGSAGSRRAQAFIQSRFVELGLQSLGAGYAMPLSFSVADFHGLYMPNHAFRTAYPSAVNVVGYMRGKAHPERHIVISARYDTRVKPEYFLHNSQESNRSGVAAMLAIAEYFKKRPPRNSIIFAAFDAGLLGQAGAAAFIQNPPVPLHTIALNLNLDNIGDEWAHTLYVAGAYHTEALAPILEQALSWSPRKFQAGHDRPGWRTGFIGDWTDDSGHRFFHERGIPFLYASVHYHISGGKNRAKTRYKEAWDMGGTVSFLTTLAIELDRNLYTLPQR